MKTKNFFNSVTSFSTVTAAVLFVILPLFGFLLGVRYEDAVMSANTEDMYYMLQKAMVPNKKLTLEMTVKKYTIPSLALLFSYPDGWKVSEENGATKLMHLNDQTKAALVNSISIKKWSKSKLMKTAEDIKIELEKDKTVKAVSMTVGGVNGYEVSKTDAQGVKSADVYFMNSAKDVVVVSMVDVDGTIAPIFAKVLSSMQFAPAMLSAK